MHKSTLGYHSTKTVLLILAVFSILAGTIALADGDTRLATKAEKDFTRLVQSTLAKAMPPGPGGWEQTGDTTVIKDIERVTTGAEAYPLQVEYCIAWQDTKRIQEANVQESLELEKLAKNPADITDKNVEAIMIKTAPHDARAKTSLLANRLSYGVYEQVSPAAAIAGGLVYRSTGAYRPSNSWTEGSTYVFLGKGWKMSGSGGGTYMNFTPNKGLPHTTVQNIALKIQADPKRAQEIAGKIDWEALKKLIKS